ncbi:MAG TPA: malto-oligosyltrehalose synthase, partial [Acidimicrobiales bacterium]|nr:malto-oligosyltrehalose synthase [Acidimicrobiales bacterium]
MDEADPPAPLGPVRATYRVQLNASFTFDDAAGLAGYLADLGVSHLYCSPILQAAPGSTHGYDVVDHGRLNEELGGADGHARMTKALADHGVGQVVDIVPNHMAVSGRANAWWWDVLENGPSSRYASYFDIDWDPPERKLIAQVLVPLLGDHYGRVLENGELAVARHGGSFVIRYHDDELPVSPRTMGDVLQRAAERLATAATVPAAVADDLAALAAALNGLPHALETDRASVLERHGVKEMVRERLDRLCDDRPDVGVAVDAEVEALNADIDELDILIGRQNYRLAYWRTAGRELDYRRFFDITSLVALRVESDYVFEDTHELVLSMVRDGTVQGLRIDHVDGLRRPARYLDRLRAGAGPGAFIVVEKILEGDERLRPSWPVQGTSGYDFLAQVNDLLVDPAGEEAMTAAYARFTGDASEFGPLGRLAKHEIMRDVLAADIERLTEQFVLVAEHDRRNRDFTRGELRSALRETIAAFDVYRTYVAHGAQPDPEDVERVEHAVALAAEGAPRLDPELFRFLADVLLLRRGGSAGAALAERFQQVSSPVMAKGVEDTALYRYLRLVSLNEVGGDPGRFGGPVADFHERRRGASGAGSMLATSTHDTKRSEDVRARLAALAEVPDAWHEAVWRWAHDNERHRVEGVPDRSTEYLLYQTVVGAWPLAADRALAYMEKATKEAKVHTSWIDPVPAYDDAVRGFVTAVLSDAGFRADVEAFLTGTGLVGAGRRNSLAQIALKLTTPGVPDLYQGTELWDLSLVDPDNRRPVDYDLRRRVVAGAEADGAEKLRLLRALLHLRRDRPELFDADAGYTVLAVDGPDAERVIAFERAGGAL